MLIRAAVDWGSSSFRAYRFDAGGLLLDTVSSQSGIKFIDSSDSFEKTLQDQIGQWLSPGDTVLLSGMITSRNGWQETPYIETPANLNTMLQHSQRVSLGPINLIFMPGVCQKEPADVMRGEELQLLGASEGSDRFVCVLPGTHSKWVLMENCSVQTFSTIPTGELFELLVKHSLVGALVKDDEWCDQSFEEGIQRGFTHQRTISDLFTARSSVLLSQKTGAQTYSWLSGLLIGTEFREGASLFEEAFENVHIIGAEQLSSIYVKALDVLEISCKQLDPNIAVKGYSHVIQSVQSA